MVIENTKSSSRPLTCGVPKGFVLGPILYLLCTAPLGDIMRNIGVVFDGTMHFEKHIGEICKLGKNVLFSVFQSEVRPVLLKCI